MYSFVLRASARPFIPNAPFHRVVKRVHWHPDGVTRVRRFILEASDSLPVRELIYPPFSPITHSDPRNAVPFTIPPASPTFDHLLHRQDTRPTIKEPLIRQNAVKDSVTDGFWINWCE
jgi:hypothetical protein